MDQLDEIRSKIDIVQLISEYVPLKKAGRNFKALCPFHSEKQPSFVVSPERQIFKCFGCGIAGDHFKFLMEMEKMEFGEALRTLAKRAGVELVSYRPSSQEREKEQLYTLNYQASQFYHYFLVSHPIGKKALDYILGRGIAKEQIKRFYLGFAPPLANLLGRFLISKKGYQLKDLQRAGLVSLAAGRPRDFFYQRIIFPLKDHRGNIVGFSGRVLPNGDKNAPKYINIGETPVYQKGHLLYGLDLAKEAIKKENAVVVVEGELDVISSFKVGVENVVAIKGSALSQEQCQLLKRFCETMILAFDQDIAGDMACRRGIEIADEVGFEIKVAKLPEGKDPDKLAQEDPQAWKKALRQATPVYDFFIDSALSRFDSSSSFGKRKIGVEVLPVLKKVSDSLVQAHYVKKLADQLDLPEDSLFTQMEKITLPEERKPAGPQPEPEKPPRRQLLEEYLLAFYFQAGQEKNLLKEEVLALVKTPALVRIAKFLKKYFTRQKRFSSEVFAKSLPQELLEIFNTFFLKDLGDKVEDKLWRDKEAKKTLFELEKIDLQEKLKALSSQIGLLEKEGRLKELEARKEDFRLFSQKLSKLVEESR